MDIRKLEVFRKVYELKSFSRAGDETYLSQPTVSGHIKYLEDYLECKLFDRLGKEVVPTRAGDILYEYAVEIIDLREKAEYALNQFQGKMKGKLLIGGSTIPGGYILPLLLGAFRSKYKDVLSSLQWATPVRSWIWWWTRRWKSAWWARASIIPRYDTSRSRATG